MSIDKDCLEDGEFVEVLDFNDFENLHPYIAAIIAYVHAQSKNKDRPKRKHINPAEIQPLLPYLAILETKYDGDVLKDVRVRLVGTELATLYGEVTDTLISDHPNEDASRRIMANAMLASTSKKIIVGSAERFDEEKNFVKVKSVVIPLFDDEGDPDKVTQLLCLVIF